MRNLADKIKLKKVNIDNLINYGFKRINNKYIYKQYISDEFYVEIVYEKNNLRSKVVEIDECEYLLVDIKSSNGSFVSKIKLKYESIIDDIIDKCFDNDIFKYNQTKRVIKYVKDKYNTDLEYLWPDTPNCAVGRNTNNKWYFIIMTVSKRKLDLDSDDIVEIINVKHPSDRIDKIIDNKNIHKAYHMNKKNWITIILDGKIPDKKLFKLINTSYILTFD